MSLTKDIIAILPGDDSERQLTTRLESLFKEHLAEHDRRTLETVAAILSGYEKGVGYKKVNETAQAYIRNKLEMLEESK